MTYSRGCGVSPADCAAAECRCGPTDVGGEIGQEKPAQRVILCGTTCGHSHDALNGLTGCCAEHGPFMYFCGECHADPIQRAHNTSREDV